MDYSCSTCVNKRGLIIEVAGSNTNKSYYICLLAIQQLERQIQHVSNLFDLIDKFDLIALARL